MSRNYKIISEFKSLLSDKLFQYRHKIGNQSFVRNRKLNFHCLVLFILSKSVKNLQNSLNEFLNSFSHGIDSFSASAFTQARCKLSYNAFIELNEKVIVSNFYKDNSYKMFKNKRLLAVDGSKLVLPRSAEIEQEFGTIAIATSQKETQYYIGAIASTLYDVLNNIVVDSILSKSSSYEGDLALQHLDKSSDNDLIIFDRGYGSYNLFTQFIQKNRSFICRCQKSFFKEVNDFFAGNSFDKIVTIKKPKYKAKYQQHLPDKIKIRLVKVILDDGEIEVLASNLLDYEQFPYSDFKLLYWYRWKIETLYDRLKNLLNLENFTGKTVESVRQDFYSTILISNLESVLIEDAEAILDGKITKNKLNVNKAISFNVLKRNVIELFYKENNINLLIEKLTKLFVQCPTSERINRKFKRDMNNPQKSANYHKRNKKVCY